MLIDCKLGKGVVDVMKKGSMPAANNLAIIANYLEVSTDFLIGNKACQNNTFSMSKVEFEYTLEKVQNNIINELTNYIGFKDTTYVVESMINKTSQIINDIKQEVKDKNSYEEERGKYIKENASLFAAAGGDSSHLEEAQNLFDLALDEQDELQK